VSQELKTVVTERKETTTDRQLQNVEVVSMPWWKIVLVRASRVYLQGLIGFLTANTSGATEAVTGIPMGDFGHQITVAASLAVAPAVLAVLMNVVELLARLDQSHPSMRA
jgi:hypothetical protein